MEQIVTINLFLDAPTETRSKQLSDLSLRLQVSFLVFPKSHSV